MYEITMDDGLVIVLRKITSNTPISVWEATSLTGGPAGFRGFGRTSSDAVVNLYQVMDGET